MTYLFIESAYAEDTSIEFALSQTVGSVSVKVVEDGTTANYEMNRQEVDRALGFFSRLPGRDGRPDTKDHASLLRECLLALREAQNLTPKRRHELIEMLKAATE